MDATDAAAIATEIEVGPDSELLLGAVKAGADGPALERMLMTAKGFPAELVAHIKTGRTTGADVLDVLAER